MVQAIENKLVVKPLGEARKYGGEEITLDELLVSRYQPRRLSSMRSPKQQEYFDGIVVSLKTVGQLNDALVRVLANGKYELMAGHMRAEAAKALKWKSLRCKVYENVDELTAMYVVGADNFERIQVKQYEMGCFFRAFSKALEEGFAGLKQKGISKKDIEEIRRQIAELFHYEDKDLDRWIGFANGIDELMLPFTPMEKGLFIDAVSIDALQQLIKIRSKEDRIKGCRMVVEGKSLQELKEFVQASLKASDVAVPFSYVLSPYSVEKTLNKLRSKSESSIVFDNASDDYKSFGLSVLDAVAAIENLIVEKGGKTSIHLNLHWVPDQKGTKTLVAKFYKFESNGKEEKPVYAPSIMLKEVSSKNVINISTTAFRIDGTAEAEENPSTEELKKQLDQVRKEKREIQQRLDLFMRSAKSLKISKPGEIKVKHVLDSKRNIVSCVHFDQAGKPLGTIKQKLT